MRKYKYAITRYEIKNEKIDYIVEWWEDDSLDIDSNQHVLFPAPKSSNHIRIAAAQNRSPIFPGCLKL